MKAMPTPPVASSTQEVLTDDEGQGDTEGQGMQNSQRTGYRRKLELLQFIRTSKRRILLNF